MKKQAQENEQPQATGETGPQSWEWTGWKQFWLPELWQMCRDFGRLTRSEWGWILGAILLVGVLIWLILPLDDALLASIKDLRDDDVARGWADFFGTYGDYPYYSLATVLIFLLLGTWKRRQDFIRIGLAIFLGASIAGLIGNFFRLTVGRPRPNAADTVPDGVYGLMWKGRYHAFPSGHTSTAFGTGAAVAAAYPPAAIPALAISGATAWARVHQKAHRPTDILGGMLLGITIGGLFGYISRRRNGRGVKLGVKDPPDPAS
jgi:membrane-associated phospholipid phosphatase